jgi:serine/threonine-protein kinase
MGTAQYLSPEQAQGTAAEEASDLYSIGVMLFEMLTGQLPFDGESAVAVALRHLTEPPPPIHTLRPMLQSMQPGQETADWAAVTAVAGYEQRPYETMVAAGPHAYPEERRDGPRRLWPWITAALLLLALVAAGLIFASESNKVAVPGVIGTPVGQARTFLEQRGFQVNVDRKKSEQPLDQVIEQDPAAGDKAKEGSTVNLTVSDGPPDEVIPDVEGLPLKQALNTLRKAGFQTDINEESSDTVKKGIVIGTTPQGGTLLGAGDRVTVDVSSGPPRFAVPNLIGLDQDAAETALEDKDLVPVVQEQESDQPEGKVFQQDPAPNTQASKGDRVTITVSKGPGAVSVPDTVGLTRGDARGELQQAGFNVEVRTRDATDPADDDIVLDQRPGHGTQLKKGRTVIIYVGQYQPPPDTGTTTTPTDTTTTPPPATLTPGTTGTG